MKDLMRFKCYDFHYHSRATNMHALITIVIFLGSIIMPPSTMAHPLEKMETPRVNIEIITTTNVNGRCNAESHLRKLGGFGFAVNGCAFWVDTAEGRMCTIFLEKSAPPELLGHEVLHCVSGAYHK
jgi:hypothetical protein